MTWRRNGVTTLDIAKRLLDFGIHPPTIYFPLVVHGALMIEPTETETRETLEEFVAAMEQIYAEAQRDPQSLKDAPHTLALKRVDEAHGRAPSGPALASQGLIRPWAGVSSFVADHQVE